MNGRKIVLTIAAALALVAGGTAAGAAIASGPVDSSGVIHGCYTTTAIGGSHTFKLQNAGTRCPAGTTAIMWNEKGPQGPAGPQGPTGPQGPSGPLTGYAALGQLVSVPAGATNYGAVAYCPNNPVNGGHQVSVGGGGSPSGPDVTILASWPTYDIVVGPGITTSIGWTVLVNNSNTTQAENVDVRVICADFDPGSAYAGTGTHLQKGDHIR